MYCKHCGGLLDETTVHTACPVQPEPAQPKFYTAGFVLGILSLCVPFYGFILGIIGLVFGCLSKRRSSIIMSSIGIGVSVIIFVLYIIFIVFVIRASFEGLYPFFDELHHYLDVQQFNF